MSTLKNGEVQIFVQKRSDRRVRVELLTRLDNSELWAIHKDIGPRITEREADDAFLMLLHKLMQRVELQD